MGRHGSEAQRCSKKDNVLERETHHKKAQRSGAGSAHTAPGGVDPVPICMQKGMLYKHGVKQQRTRSSDGSVGSVRSEAVHLMRLEGVAIHIVLEQRDPEEADLAKAMRNT